MWRAPSAAARSGACFWWRNHTPEARRYLNRLSDLLFILARAANGGNEPLWQPGLGRGGE